MKDYSKYPRTSVIYSGAERKFEIVINKNRYIVKFQKNSEVGPMNNCISEYIGSHLFQMFGIDAQETYLGMCDGKQVVVMKNFLGPNEILVAFNGVGESSLERDKEIYQYTYEDIICMLNENVKSTNVMETIERFWDMFIVDALIGNFDRHGGNWGFIKKEGRYHIAPVYDNGSCLYPKCNSEDKMKRILSSKEEIDRRVYEFPTSHIKIGYKKSSYFEVINSLSFPECNKALERIMPRIHLKKVNQFIDDIEGISEFHRLFYKEMLKHRYEKILLPAYQKLKGGKENEIS